MRRSNRSRRIAICTPIFNGCHGHAHRTRCCCTYPVEGGAIVKAVLPGRTAPRGEATNALAKRLPTIKATAACWREREQARRILLPCLPVARFVGCALYCSGRGPNEPYSTVMGAPQVICGVLVRGQGANNPSQPRRERNEQQRRSVRFCDRQNGSLGRSRWRRTQQPSR